MSCARRHVRSSPCVDDAPCRISVGGPGALIVCIKKPRLIGAAARDLADRYFFETVLRLHRAGEGEPFTGLKDIGETDEALESADQSLATGFLDPVVKLVTERAAAGVRERFARVRDAQASAGTSVAAGRRYVEAYVEFIHYVEALRGQLDPSPSR